MKEEIKDVKMRELIADDGKWFTQSIEMKADERTFSKRLILGMGDDPGNWKEISEEEKTSLEAEAQKEIDNMLNGNGGEEMK